MSELIPYLLQELKNETEPIKQSALIAQLKRQGVATKALAQAMNVSPTHVCHLFRLNKLPEMVIDGYYSRLLSISHLIFISRLPTDAAMQSAYEQVVSQNLSALATERLVRQIQYGVKTIGQRFDLDHIKGLEDVLASAGVALTVRQTRIASKIILEKRGSFADTTDWIREVIAVLQQTVAHVAPAEDLSEDPHPQADSELDPVDGLGSSDKTPDR